MCSSMMVLRGASVFTWKEILEVVEDFMRRNTRLAKQFDEKLAGQSGVLINLLVVMTERERVSVDTEQGSNDNLEAAQHPISSDRSSQGCTS